MKNKQITFYWDGVTFSGDKSNANSSLSFYNCDSPKEYKQRSAEQLANRDYTDIDFTYKFNSMGFRSDELNLECDNKILFAGDSFAFGEGAPLDRLWCHRYLQHVAETSGVPLHYYNVGLCGASSKRVLRNIIASTNAYKFDKVIAIFASWTRFSFIVNTKNNDFMATDFQPAFALKFPNADSKDFYKVMNEETLFIHWVQDIMMAKMHCDLMKVPFYWFTWDHELDPTMLPKQLQACMIKMSPYKEHMDGIWRRARDGMHPGDAYHNYLFESLKLYFRDK